MPKLKGILKKEAFRNILLGVFLCIFSGKIFSTTLNLPDSPLSVTQSAAPLTMLVMARDHKLFYEAYNDFSDINGDGILDLYYNPAITYYGYFDSFKCYSYDFLNKYFYPVQPAGINKICTSPNLWSGDWLNWATMSRIDLLRKALYGGKRVQPEALNATYLEAAASVQDAHSWGKEYTRPAIDGYAIEQYTPYSQPISNDRKHLFAITTLLNETSNIGYQIGIPLLRVLPNQAARIWDWVSKERPVAGQSTNFGAVAPTDYVLRVKVCDNAVGLESNCKVYPNGQYKPTGLIQNFGENESMKFGLITGSYEKNLSGGVLRKNIADLADEINSTNGTVKTATSGIIKTIDNLIIPEFGGYYVHQGGWIVNRAPNQGEFKPWGNPIGEMMYEAMRYFAGKNSPTSDYATSGGVDSLLGLPSPSWINPYSTNPYCAKPNILVVSDTSPSYDSDQIPGTAFSSFSGDLSPSLNASDLGQIIWNTEKGSASTHFIGQSGTNYDGAPTAKAVTSFGNIRGLAPEEPTKQGSYYSASVAYYGFLNDLNSVKDDQKPLTSVLALNTPLPKVNIFVNGKIVTLIPFAKTVGGCNYFGLINAAKGYYQPTNQIVDFYIENWTPTSGTFRVNFEDVEQGADHDMDAIVRYTYTVNSNGTLTVNVENEYDGGCLIQHMGYVISGTTQDGTYLEVRDKATDLSSDILYFLDTPPGQLPGQRDNSTKLPLTATRTFTIGSNPAATILESPLWYAAKWGNFEDKNNNGMPDTQDEWDADNDGVPDNYFHVTKPTELVTQLRTALTNILKRSSSSASAAVSSGSWNTNTRLYQVLFSSGDWTGKLLSFPILADGSLDTSGSASNGAEWDAGTLLNNQSYQSRNILTYKISSKLGIAFRWPNNPHAPSSSELDKTQIDYLNLNPITNSADSLGSKRLNYIRGEKTFEKAQGGLFRNRSSLLGDIINSAPIYITSPAMPYPDIWASNAAENNSPYSQFRFNNRNRAPMIYVGANDGMLHGFNALTGIEKFAYVPSSVYKKLNQLTSANYTHQFYVDGSPNVMDAYINGNWKTVLVSGLNKGGQGIFALDVTDAENISESLAQQTVLWEFTDLQDKDLGYTFSQPAIVRQPNGVWVAIFGNGYNANENDGVSTTSTTGNAVLYVVNLATGAMIQKLDTQVGLGQNPYGDSKSNGLATPVIVDQNGDFSADLIYAGDRFGNLWKWYWNSNTNSWTTATYGTGYPTPIFTAKDSNNKNQPITSRPTAKRILGGIQLYFGTGQYLEPTDKNIATATPQSFYSIIDNLDVSTSAGRIMHRSELLQQSILEDSTYTSPDNTVSYDVRITTNYVKTNSHRGWFLDLVAPGNTNLGERQVSQPILRNNRVIFTTLIPDNNVCSFGGTGWLMELDALSGARLSFPPFDLNNDKKFTSHDNPTINNQSIAVSGVKSKVGIIPMPSIISAGKLEYKYMSGSSGQIGQITEQPGTQFIGRQSWRELN